MKTDSASERVISVAMMQACVAYSTSVAVVNEGARRDAKVEKLKEIFSEPLEVVQKASWPKPRLKPSSWKFDSTSLVLGYQTFGSAIGINPKCMF